MKKVIAILLVVVAVVLVGVCIGTPSKEDEALLAAVQQDLINSRYKTKFDTAGSKIDTVYVVTFTEDTITYKVTSGDANNSKYHYTAEYSYTLKMKNGEPFIKVHTNFYEDLRVNIVAEELREEGGEIVHSLQGDKAEVGHHYSRIR